MIKDEIDDGCTSVASMAKKSSVQPNTNNQHTPLAAKILGKTPSAMYRVSIDSANRDKVQSERSVAFSEYAIGALYYLMTTPSTLLGRNLIGYARLRSYATDVSRPG